MNNGKQLTLAGGLVVTYSPVLAEKILTPADAAANGIANDKHRVQLRQEVLKSYPAARENALFGSLELSGGNAGQTFAEKRVMWLTVPGPQAGTSIESYKAEVLAIISARLAEMECPTLVKTLDLQPILSEEQIRTIENGVNPKSYSDYEQDFIVDGNGSAVQYRGQNQFRKITFSKAFNSDIDFRAERFHEKATPIQIAESSAVGVAVKTL